MTATPKHFHRRSSCPACESPRFKTLYSAPFSEGPILALLMRVYRQQLTTEKLSDASYVLDECSDCTLAFQRFVPSDELLEDLYDRWLNSGYHPDGDEAYAAAIRTPRHSRDGHELFAAARVLRRPVDQLRVLDYGMGWGQWARTAHALGCATYGFDLSESRRAYARQHGITVVAEPEFTRLELDFINTEQVLEHVARPAEDVTVLSRALRVGGILKIAVPQAPDLARRLAPADWNAPRHSSRHLDAVHPLEHLNCWNPRALESLARRAGLEPIEIPLPAYFAFVEPRIPSGVHELRALIKGLLRPAYHRFSRANLYRWFRKVREPA